MNDDIDVAIRGLQSALIGRLQAGEATTDELAALHRRLCRMSGVVGFALVGAERRQAQAGAAEQRACLS